MGAGGEVRGWWDEGRIGNFHLPFTLMANDYRVQGIFEWLIQSAQWKFAAEAINLLIQSSGVENNECKPAGV